MPSTHPVTTPASTAAPAPPLASPGGSTATPRRDRGTLLAEDDPKMADLLTRALLRGGFQPMLAVTGDEALAAMRGCQSFAAAVLDIMIPHPDGIEVCRQLRRDRWGGPIVVISALSGADVLGRARSAGADLFLTKPFRLGSLVDALATMIDGHPQRGEER